MYTLLSLIIFRNSRSVITLFLTVLFASTGFLIITELTANIEASVARETKPIFGADLRISHEGITPRPIIETFGPYLSGTSYRWGETREFSTTLLTHEGKTGLIQVIAYIGEYPQKGILETVPLTCDCKVGNNPCPCSESGNFRENTEGSSSGILKNTAGISRQKVSASDDLLNGYVSGGTLMIDGKLITVTDRITKSSDLGFSFGNDNSLIILPMDLLTGSNVISSGSRLSEELYLSFTDSNIAEKIKKSIGEGFKEYRIRTFAERSEQSLDVVDQLSDYILLVLLVSYIFAAIVMRSAHDQLFHSLARTLSIVEILGLTRKRQVGLFIVVYSIIIPLAALLSMGLGYGAIFFIKNLPGAEAFTFLSTALPLSFSLLGILILISFFPAWRKKINFSFTLWSRDIILPGVTLILCYFAVFLIFSRPLFSLGITLGAFILFLLVYAVLLGVYRILFGVVTPYRFQRFALFDGLRTHVRPFSPSIPITISLISITIFLIIFTLFSLSFRTSLTIDTKTTPNIFAINILESDKERVEKYLSDNGNIYDVIRARIISINKKTLAEHLNTTKPTGEFTREFNITTTPLSNRITEGKETLEKNEVSIDDAFSKRLGVHIGDEIEFLISGKSVPLTIANIRDSRKVGFTPFFFFSLSKEAFKNAPRTYFATTNTQDTERWKKGILENSGNHVTFIEVDSILTIVQNISEKIISIISLFFIFILAFALFAILRLFGQMELIEQMKYRLYPLFGYKYEILSSTINITRGSICMISWILSILIGVSLAYYLIRSSTFLSLSWVHTISVIIISLFCFLTIIFLTRAKGGKPSES